MQERILNLEKGWELSLKKGMAPSLKKDMALQLRGSSLKKDIACGNSVFHGSLVLKKMHGLLEKGIVLAFLEKGGEYDVLSLKKET